MSSAPFPTTAHAAFTAAAAQHRLAPGCDTFYFLRHGQTARNAARIFQDADEPLDATGHAQAAAAAALLAPAGIAGIVASDMRRTCETAAAVDALCAVGVETLAGLRERHFGALIGTSSVALDWSCAPEGGETLPRFVARTASGLADALSRPAPVLVVAHGGTLHALAALLGLAPTPAWFANALPLRLDRAGDGWRASLLEGAGDGLRHLS